MPKLTWTVTHTPVGGAATDITSRVLSATITQGRPQYLDQYSGGSITLTINNSADFAAGIGYGSNIQITDGYLGAFILICWVEEVTYQDYPGNTGLNTATITAVDWISRAGRIQATDFFIAENPTGLQLRTFEGPLGPLPDDMLIGATGSGSSEASAITYTGTVANYLNLLQTTERGLIILRGSTLNFFSRSDISTFFAPIATTLGRTTSTTQIAYQEFNRIQNGSQFINTASISSAGVATQTETNSASATTYGPAFYSSETVDYNATQASGNAGWIVNNFSDPTSLRFEVQFTDVAQNATALTSYMTQCWGTFDRAINLTYQVPGGSSTTTAVVMEGLTLDITPTMSTFRMTLSPLQYYQFFTLDSSILGILDTSRLGW